VELQPLAQEVAGSMASREEIHIAMAADVSHCLHWLTTAIDANISVRTLLLG